MPNLLDQTFNPSPGQWGFRGDPHMWETLKGKLGEITVFLDSEAFNTLLDQSFNDIIAEDGVPRPNNSVYFEKFPRAGMSGGLISMEWWQDTGLPLLKKRYADLLS